MSNPAQPPSDQTADNAAHPDEIIDRFEEAWLRGEQPDIESFLPQDAGSRPPLLIELIHIDLERRIKNGMSIRVEDYLSRFTDLAAQDHVLLDLLESEHELRRRYGTADSVASYHRRFPRLGEALALRLLQPRHRPGRAKRINCPDCREPIETLDDGSGSDIHCPGCGSSFTLDRTPEMSWDSARLPRIGKFQLLDEAGRGSFGTVYRARDTELERLVAIKVPRSGQLATAEDEDRFVREARSVARLRHPGIVPVHEVGRSDTFPYIVCEFVEGVTLADWLTTRRIPFREAAELIAMVADALEHAHRHGTVHRDLKPSNIILERVAAADSVDSSAPGSTVTVSGDWGVLEFRPRLMDFGLARRDEGEVTMTVDGQPLGTPAYMSPEQAGGDAHRVDGRSDVWSLGVILYELLAGELPFRGNSRMLLHQVLNEEPRPPRRLNDRIPRDLETVTLKCMAKEAGRRYGSAAALAADLRRWLAGEPILARPIGRIGRAYRWCRRKPAQASLLAALALLAAASIAALLLWQQFEMRWQLAEQQRIQERLLRLSDARTTVESLEARAMAELTAGRLDGAVRSLEQAIDRCRDDVQLADLRQRVQARRDRVHRLVEFYRLADDAERLEFQEYDDEATIACEAALENLHVLRHTDWWNHLPADDLTPERHDQLREDAYRQLLLLSALRAKRGLLNFASPAAAHAYRSALETIHAAQAYRPSHAARFAEAFCHIGLRQADQVRPMPAMQPTSPADYYFVGMLHFWLAAFPNDPISQFAFGPVRKLGGIDFDTPRVTAEWMLRNAARLEPKYYWNHFWLGWCLAANDNPKGAELAYNSCVAIRPDYALGYAERARVLIEQLDEANPAALNNELRHRAVQDLDRAAALAPYDARIHWARAIAFEWLDQMPEAIAAATRAIELERPLAAWAGRRIYLEKRQGIATVGQIAAELTAAEPDNAQAWALNAIANLALDKLDEASSSAARCLELRPQHPAALAVRGSVQLRSGHIELASDDFNAALAAAPDYFQAAFGKARTLEHADRLDEALAHYQALHRLAVTEWQRAESLIGQARVLARQGKQAQALARLDLAQQLDAALTATATVLPQPNP